MSRELPQLKLDEYLREKGFTQESFQVSDPDENPIGKIDTRQTVEKLQIGHDDLDLKTDEGRKGAELQHRIHSRSTILKALVVPMYIIPLWLMVILSLPALKVNAYSEKMQFTLLGALASDVIGLCYVVTRDLFPKGSSSQDEDDKAEDET
ncbi:hypothetical protein ACN4EG_08485 [Alkalinema pantanalense CENA528]|uniref:hypothetical protein n=1 Tax=Alkalinema pantanalense TaxID=1620705 RepID=UPI003D6FC9A3